MHLLVFELMCVTLMSLVCNVWDSFFVSGQTHFKEENEESCQ